MENLLAPVSFCQNPTIQLSSGTEGPARNRHDYHFASSRIIRLAGLNGPWLDKRLRLAKESRLLECVLVCKRLNTLKSRLSFNTCFRVNCPLQVTVIITITITVTITMIILI